MSELFFIGHPTPDTLGDTPLCFLRNLAGPSVIDVPGFDTGRTRVVSILVHGNEPSGAIALHHWLQEGHKPACNMRFIISSVEAALTDEFFSNRFLPEDADLNRCFDGDGPAHMQSKAKAICTAITEVNPEAVVDLHNTSGSGPGFSVSVNSDIESQKLVGFFCDTMIITSLKIGSLMEQDFGCPIVTIECGGAKESTSHKLAYQGLCRFANAMHLNDSGQNPVTLLYNPLRVQLPASATISYAHEYQETTDICLLVDIEQYNIGVTKAGTLLGWVNAGDETQFLVQDQIGNVRKEPLFDIKNKALYTRYDMRIFMATNNALIAKQDCLFYAIV